MNYIISTSYWYLREEDTPEDRIAFHVQTGDCFATLATEIGLVEDSLKDAALRNEPPGSSALMLLASLREDLLRLHQDYRIEPKRVLGETTEGLAI